MLGSIFVFISVVLMIASIIFDWKIKIRNVKISLYYIICLIGAILCLSFGCVGGANDVKEIFLSKSSINPIKILVIFLSCTSISVLLDKIGFFSFVASKILQKAKASQTKLFFAFSIIISLLTIFTSNDILILTFTPFICYFAKYAKIDPTPYIVSEFVCANVWSMFFLIGNPTNIYLATSFNIAFAQYFLRMVLPTIACGLVGTTICFLIFRKKLKKPLNVQEVAIFRPEKSLLIVGLVGLFLMIILMAISSYISLDIWYIPLVCSILTYLAVFVCLLVKKQGFGILKNAIFSLPYSLVPFLLSMSVFVAVLNKSGITEQFANFLSGKNIFVVGLFAFLLGNLLNNIPMTMFFTSVLGLMTTNYNIMYSVIAASNVCALLTPIGSLAGIMFLQILKNNNVKYKAKDFVKYGLITSIPTIVIGILIIAFV